MLRSLYRGGYLTVNNLVNNRNQKENIALKITNYPCYI